MKKWIYILLCAILAGAVFSDCGKSASVKQEVAASTAAKKIVASTAAASAQSEKMLTGKHHVEIDVKNYGVIKCELDADVAPITVTNFIKLAKAGFYNGTTFHRIINGFMVQGGDPTGTGSGGSSDTIKGEFSENGVQNKISHVRGTLSMARDNDKNSASSQFFIVQKDSAYLDGKYAAFGHVTQGMEAVDAMCKDVSKWGADSNGMVPASRQPVMTSVKVVD